MNRAVGHGKLGAAGVSAREGVAVPPLIGWIVFPGDGVLGVGRVRGGGDGVVHVTPGVLIIFTAQRFADHDGTAGAVADIGDLERPVGLEDHAVAGGAAVV